MSYKRFLLDENVGHALRDALFRLDRAIEVLVIGGEGAPPLGTPDPEILVWLEQNDYCLATNNRASMPPHLGVHLQAGGHVPGIFVMDAVLSVGAAAEALHLVYAAATPEEFDDQITYLPLRPRR